jgi:hypothetical protein
MAYRVEEREFIVKGVYHTSSFVTVQRQFRRKFNRRQAPARSTISHLVQKFEELVVSATLRGVMGSHLWAHTQLSVARFREALRRRPRKSVTRCSQSLGIKRTVTHTHHATGLYVVSLQYPSGIGALRVWVVLAALFTGHKYLQLFALGLYQDRVHCAQPVRCSGVASGIWHFAPCSWQFVVRLQRVHEVEGSHIEHVFTWRPHVHELSMKVTFHSCTL